MSGNAASQSAALGSTWSDDPSPLRHQSITELLHDPRNDGSLLELPNLLPASSGHLRAPASANLASGLTEHLPSINEFADYLRNIEHGYQAYKNAFDSPRSSMAPAGSIDTEQSSDAAIRLSGVEDIPSLYFRNDFSPSSCPEFSSLQEMSGPGLWTLEQVQRKRSILCAYLVLAKRQLLAEISLRCGHISDAATRIGELRKRVCAVANAIRAARCSTADVVSTATTGAKSIVLLGERKENAVRIKLALSAIARVLSAAEDAHALVDATNYSAAMVAVESARAALAEDHIANVQALAPARASLARAVERIDGALKEDLRNLFSADTVDPTAMKDAAMLVARLGRSQLAHRAFIEETRRGLSLGLQRVDTIDEALKLARAAVKRATLIHTTFSSLLRFEEGKSPVKAGNLTESSGEDLDGEPPFQGTKMGAESSMLSLDTTASEQSTGVAKRQGTETRSRPVGSEVTRETGPTANVYDGSSESGNSSTREVVLGDLYGDILDMLCSVVDRIYASFDSEGNHIVLLSNSEVTELNCFDEVKCVTRFGDAVRATAAFVQELEKPARSTETKAVSRANFLRSKLNERSLSFVSAVYKAHSDAMTSDVQSEKWAEAKVPRGLVRLVASLSDDSSPGQYLPLNNEDLNRNDSESPDSQVLLPSLVLSNQAFKTVSCGQRFVRSMCAFALIPSKLPFAASEACRRGVELCRHFNSLCARAILGAQALQWAGLRSITARHLALASRTVALAAAFSPSCITMLQTCVSSEHRAVFDALCEKNDKDMRNHHGQLLAKILSIMMDRLAVHEEGLRALPWSKRLEMERYEIPSTYMASLAKEATVLHKILYTILPSHEVKDIFQRVLASYGAHLSECYSSLDMNKAWIRERVTADIALLADRVAGLDVVKEFTTISKPVESLRTQFLTGFEAESDGTNAEAAVPAMNEAADAIATDASDASGLPSSAREAKVHSDCDGRQTAQTSAVLREDATGYQRAEVGRKTVDASHGIPPSNESSVPPHLLQEDPGAKFDHAHTNSISVQSSEIQNVVENVPVANGNLVDHDDTALGENLYPESSLPHIDYSTSPENSGAAVPDPENTACEEVTRNISESKAATEKHAPHSAVPDNSSVGSPTSSARDHVEAEPVPSREATLVRPDVSADGAQILQSMSNGVGHDESPVASSNSSSANGRDENDKSEQV